VPTIYPILLPRLDQRPDGPVSVNWNSPQARGLELLAPLTGPSTQDLVSGRAYRGVSVGQGGYPRLNTATQFAAASGSYLDMTAPAFLPTATKFSAAAWVMTDTTASSGGGGGLRYILGCEDSGPTGQFAIRYSPSAGQFQAFFFASGIGVTSTTTVAAHTLYLVGVSLDTADFGTIKLYVNGRLEDTATGVTTLDSTVTALTVGNDGGFNSRTRQWSGLIGSAAIWSRNIGDDGHRALYQQPWDLYATPTRRSYVFIGDGGGFQAAWARGRNVILGAGAP
jgi:hypothetical protein